MSSPNKYSQFAINQSHFQCFPTISRKERESESQRCLPFWGHNFMCSRQSPIVRGQHYSRIHFEMVGEARKGNFAMSHTLHGAVRSGDHSIKAFSPVVSTIYYLGCAFSFFSSYNTDLSEKQQNIKSFQLLPLFIALEGFMKIIEYVTLAFLFAKCLKNRQKLL